MIWFRFLSIMLTVSSILSLPLFSYPLTLIFFLNIPKSIPFTPSSFPSHHHHQQQSQYSVTSTLLQGIIEPFPSSSSSSSTAIPLWKVIKLQGDKYFLNHQYQLALYDYGQLLRHSYLLYEMPIQERYQLYLTLAKILTSMGYSYRAELLLLEASSYINEPYDVYYQLSLIYLDKEEIELSKLYFKNSLYYKENDLTILVYLSTILLSEGKIYEAKFYITRVLSHLEIKITQLSILLNKDTQQLLSDTLYNLTTPQYHAIFRLNLEDLIIKVYSCEYLLIPSATLETYRFFSLLLDWIQRNEMNGRFLFDLGQSLYERGKSTIGLKMMLQGQHSSDLHTEGKVSIQVIQIRLALEYSSIPNSMIQIVEYYLNITEYLASGPSIRIDLENIIDVYWPLPLLGWSGLPMAPVIEEFASNFFQNIPIRRDYYSQLWLTHHLNITTCLPYPSRSLNRYVLSKDEIERETKFHELEKKYGRSDVMSLRKVDISRKLPNHRNANLRDIGFPIELGLLGGHFNSHPVGRYLLHRFLKNFNSQKKFLLTLIALPLIPDSYTNRIAQLANRIINLPADPTQGWDILQKLNLDIILFPDWQPFPDTQSIFFQSTRIAPVQICLFIRGSSCGTNAIDYYLLPNDLQDAYLNTFKKRNSPIYLESHTEQVVLLDWPIMTSSSILDLAAAPGDSLESQESSIPSDDQQHFIPNELEGKVFFDGQPVALLAIDPSYLHPMMDDALLTLLRSISDLQILLVIPEIFANVLPSSTPQSPSLSEYKLKSRYLSLEWAKKLARRLWTKGGENIHQRVRLFPHPISDNRLILLMKQVDVILDTFPIGNSLYPLALGLSVGTPIVTLQCGTQFSSFTSQEEKDFRQFLLHSHQKYSQNNIYQHILHENMTIPWLSSISSLSSFYTHLGIHQDLVARNISEYISLVTEIIQNKEKSYEIRVRILDYLDEYIYERKLSGSESSGTSATTSTSTTTATTTSRMNRPSPTSWSHSNIQIDESMKDLERFLLNIGIDWARARVMRKARCVL